MALDYSKLSDAELEAIANDDYSKLSESTLNAMAEEDKPREKSLGEKAATVAGGVAGTAVDLGHAAWNVIPYKEIAVPYAGYKAIPHLVEGAKSGARAVGTLMSPSAPIAPGPNPASNPMWTASEATPKAPSMIERGTQYAKEMQRIAAEKVMQGARAAAPYVAPVARAGGAAAAALVPGNIGQNYPVPQSGPYRGMEINPNTGRPWTPEELAGMR